MFRPRIIPVLLLQNQVLIKSIKFKKYNYIGDPINAVRIFNELKADELVFLDINATREKRLISLEFVKVVGEEANMPFAVGGGIKQIEDIRKIISAGAEKVIINTEAINNPEFIKEATEYFGSSTIVVCIDVKQKLFKGRQVYSHAGAKPTATDPVKFAQLIESMGAGEIIIQSTDQDGVMQGYDLDLIHDISKAVKIPIVALGGAGTIDHLKQAQQNYASGLAAGSMFVYQGAQRGVLINYLERMELEDFYQA